MHRPKHRVSKINLSQSFNLTNMLININKINKINNIMIPYRTPHQNNLSKPQTSQHHNIKTHHHNNQMIDSLPP